MWALVLLPCLFLVQQVQTQQVQAQQADTDLAAGLKALDADQPAAAEESLRRAVAAAPDDYFSHFNLALALSMQNKDAEAIGEFRATLQRKPGLYEANLNLGMVLLRAKQAGDAVVVLRDAVGAKPEDAVANYYFGDALLSTGDVDGALARFRMVADGDPKSARARYGIGRALVAQGKLAEAEPFFRAAATIDLDYRDQLLSLAAQYEKAGQLQQALAIYREFPDKPGVAARMAELTAVRPSDYDVALNRAKELRDARQSEQAVQQFLAAASLRPTAPEPWREIAALLIAAKNFTKGLDALDRAKALAPEQPGELYYRAIALDSLKQRKPAVEAYSRFLAASGGKFPDQEFQARQRMRIIEEEIRRGIK